MECCGSCGRWPRRARNAGRRIIGNAQPDQPYSNCERSGGLPGRALCSGGRRLQRVAACGARRGGRGILAARGGCFARPWNLFWDCTWTRGASWSSIRTFPLNGLARACAIERGSQRQFTTSQLRIPTAANRASAGQRATDSRCVMKWAPLGFRSCRIERRMKSSCDCDILILGSCLWRRAQDGVSQIACMASDYGGGSGVGRDGPRDAAR